MNNNYIKPEFWKNMSTPYIQMSMKEEGNK